MNLKLGDTQLIIDECLKQGLLRNEAAYVLATAYHETAHTMRPVREYGGEAYLKKKKYYPYVGMGYVQLTWDYNYKKASVELGVDFMKNPKLLLDPKHAVVILVTGMREGWFTGKKLSHYFTLTSSNYVDARRMINGTDRQHDIADIAKEYYADLTKAGYGVEGSASGVAKVEPVVETPKVVVVEELAPPAAPVGEPKFNLVDLIVKALKFAFSKKGT